jgi:hypothetical protein
VFIFLPKLLVIISIPHEFLLCVSLSASFKSFSEISGKLEPLSRVKPLFELISILSSVTSCSSVDEKHSSETFCGKYQLPNEAMSAHFHTMLLSECH